MKIYKKVRELKETLNLLEKEGKTIAFVPTMGALHEGHLSLISIAKQNADLAVASIFVNPTQFNNASDLAKYPRALEADQSLLEHSGCDFLFLPTVSEIYPSGTNQKLKLELNGMDRVMEGKFRPGHFEGMLQVVKRLLDIVCPQFLIMGQKDYQQFSLVQLMIRQLQIPIQLIQGPTLRENDGLAMSSRNKRLDPIFRQKAKIIYEALLYCRTHMLIKDAVELENYCTQMIDQEGLKTEYFNIVDGSNLKKKSSYAKKDKIVACVAAWAGEVRLIDNMEVNYL